MNLKNIQFLCILSTLFAAFASAGCGSGNGSGNGGSAGGIGFNSESLTYHFKLNGCDTEEHTFSSQDDLCAGLQNETLNKSCAQSMRQDYFAKNCGSRTWNPQ